VVAGEETSTAGANKREVGATGEVVRANIKRIRDNRGLAITTLSEQLSELGRPIPPLGLRRIESGDRRVDVDDLVALAIALDVTPTTLLMPYTTVHDEPVRITAQAKPIYALNVWDWLTAYRPLDPDVAWLTFIVATWPIWRLQEFNEEMQQQLRVVGDHQGTFKWERPTPPPGEVGFDGND
jgi:transcriptional regulator with XRE-family HTH domain